jgi:putative FmdB family regulatory protein
MPVYDYQCPNCGGIFSALRPMSAFRDLGTCPDCGHEAARVFLTMPAVAGMDAARRTAIATNERASHEPKRASVRHGAGCSCCGTGQAKGKAVASPSGAKSFPKARPWMISH